MSLERYEYPSQSLAAVTAREIARRPYLPLSLLAHAALLVLAYYFGSYQPGVREREEEVAASMRATYVASTEKRLQDLETIKQLLEKSANRIDAEHEPRPTPEATPETPDAMVERARELSEAIERLDEEIRAEELAELLGTPKRPPEAIEPPAPLPPPNSAVDIIDLKSVEPAITPEMAANEVAALEARARVTLAKRQEHLEAKGNGVPVEGGATGTGKVGSGDARAASSAQSLTDMRTEIADFLATGPRDAQLISTESYARWVEDPADGGYLEVPPLDPTGLVRGHGRIFGAGGEYANRVLINSWYIIGPFPGRHDDLLFNNPVYPPEKAVLLDAVYLGKSERLLKWRYVTTQSYPILIPDLAEDGVYYGYTEVSVDEACDLVAWIGADDDAQIYVNDQLVWRGGRINKMQFFRTVYDPGATHTRDYNRSEGTRVVHFNKGRNKIFFKLSNGAQGGFLSLVLTR